MKLLTGALTLQLMMRIEPTEFLRIRK